jgi:hypothetical protein
VTDTEPEPTPEPAEEPSHPETTPDDEEVKDAPQAGVDAKP